MKVLLVVLSGDAQHACDRLAVLYPEASLEIIPRSEIEIGRFSSRLGRLRARRPDVFAIATENLKWQRGQNLFMLFGAMGGAREVVLLDAQEGLRRESGRALLSRAPLRLAREAAASASVMARARRELESLEQEIERGSANVSVRQRVDAHKQIKITYLRSTPGPGRQAGGAASHIKG